VPVEQLVAHYRQIAAAEAVEIAPAALGLIARAADGSVRDGLSLLDQAIALSAGKIEEAAVRDMLGIADRASSRPVRDRAQGRRRRRGAADGKPYQGGADPLMVMQDLLELTIS